MKWNIGSKLQLSPFLASNNLYRFWKKKRSVPNIFTLSTSQSFLYEGTHSIHISRLHMVSFLPVFIFRLASFPLAFLARLPRFLSPYDSLERSAQSWHKYGAWQSAWFAPALSAANMTEIKVGTCHTTSKSDKVFTIDEASLAHGCAGNDIADC